MRPQEAIRGSEFKAWAGQAVHPNQAEKPDITSALKPCSLNRKALGAQTLKP